MHYQTILYERRGPVATITLNRPQVLNALSVELIGEVSDALDRIEADEAVRAVVLMGAGRAFSAGYDLKESGEQPVAGVVEWRKRLERDVRFTLRVEPRLCPPGPLLPGYHATALQRGLVQRRHRRGPDRPGAGLGRGNRSLDLFRSDDGG